MTTTAKNAETIERLSGKLNNKKAFIKKVAKTFKRSPNTVANHWLNGYFTAPEEHQEKLISMLETEIKTQNEK